MESVATRQSRINYLEKALKSCWVTLKLLLSMSVAISHVFVVCRSQGPHRKSAHSKIKDLWHRIKKIKLISCIWESKWGICGRSPKGVWTKGQRFEEYGSDFQRGVWYVLHISVCLKQGSDSGFVALCRHRWWILVTSTTCELRAWISGLRHGTVALQARMNMGEVDTCGICPKPEELAKWVQITAPLALPRKQQILRVQKWRGLCKQGKLWADTGRLAFRGQRRALEAVGIAHPEGVRG